jgi:hypothetical protein
MAYALHGGARLRVGFDGVVKPEAKGTDATNATSERNIVPLIWIEPISRDPESRGIVHATAEHCSRGGGIPPLPGLACTVLRDSSELACLLRPSLKRFPLSR